jgi:hypothetical protein
MIYCDFFSKHPYLDSIPQTPGGKGIIGRVSFQVFRTPPDISNLPQGQWLAVFDTLKKSFYTRIPPERRILVITEPPAIVSYMPGYTKKFGIVLSPFKPFLGNTRHWIEGLACLNWHYGFVEGKSLFTGLENFIELKPMPKPRLLSVICSDKTITKAQIQRIKFVEYLQKRLGGHIDIFGNGRNPIQDKAEAIAPYRYHLVLENNYLRNFCTEKLTDSYIGWSFPIYVGAPNILERLPAPEGILPLTPENFTAAADKIEALLRRDPYENLLPALAANRQYLLEETNVFTRVARIIERTGEEHFPLLRRPQLIPPRQTPNQLVKIFYKFYHKHIL